MPGLVAGPGASRLALAASCGQRADSRPPSRPSSEPGPSSCLRRTRSPRQWPGMAGRRICPAGQGRCRKPRRGRLPTQIEHARAPFGARPKPDQAPSLLKATGGGSDPEPSHAGHGGQEPSGAWTPLAGSASESSTRRGPGNLGEGRPRVGGASLALEGQPGCHCQWQVGNQEPGERRSLVRSEPRGSSIQTRPACQQAATILGMQLRLPRGGAGVFLQTRQHSQRRMRPRAVGPQRGHGARLPTSVSPTLWPRSWQFELVTAEPRNAAIALLMSVLHKLLVYCPGFRAWMRVKIGSAMAALLLRQ